MGPVTVVVRDISAQYGLEMAESEDEDMVEAVAPQRPHKPLRDRVRKRCPDRRADDLGAIGPEYLVEATRIFRVAVPDEETEREGVPAGDEGCAPAGSPTTHQAWT
jgi:hypothetical protein